MNHAPATPLPWVGTCLEPGPNRPAPGVVSEAPGTVNGYRRVARAGNPSLRCRQDMRYIVHACNAYPKLVAALRDVLTADFGNEVQRWSAAQKLLLDIGETS